MASWRFTIDWALDFTGRKLYSWTAPAELRCGDFVLLYEARKQGGRGAFVAVGHAVTDSVRAYLGDERHWAYIDWRVADRPVALREVQTPDKLSVQGSHGAINQKAFDAIVSSLAAADRETRKTLVGWRQGKGFPRTNEVPLRDLVRLRLDAETNERALYPPLRRYLEAEGWLELSGEMKTAIRNLRGPLAFDPDGDYALRPDILGFRPEAKRMLVVEVKRYATPTLGYRNPIDQVLDYSRAIAKALDNTGIRGWKIEPVLVAEEFSPVVLTEASKRRSPSRIEHLSCRRWDGKRLQRI